MYSGEMIQAVKIENFRIKLYCGLSTASFQYVI